MADVVVAAALGGAGQHGQDRLEAVEGLDLGLLVDRTGPRPARADRGRGPTTSLTFSTNSGSVESLKLSARWAGARRRPRSARPPAGEIPIALAIERVDQWVASGGISSRVLTITASTLSSLIVRGAPGRGSSTEPVEALGDEAAAPLADRRRRYRRGAAPPRGSMPPRRTPTRCDSAAPGAARSSVAAPSARASSARPR